MAVENLYAAWIGILAGSLAGAAQGLFFHDERWLGGYASWPRRMTRLGHVAFFGLALINLGYVASVSALEIEDGPSWSSRLLIVAAFTMPVLCYLSAYRKSFRHLFFVPVLCVVVGVAVFLWRLLAR